MPSRSYFRNLLKKYSKYIKHPIILNIKPITAKPGHTTVKIDFSLTDSNCFYGQTSLRIREWYDQNGVKYQYRYCWEISPDKEDHITAWENEYHAVMNFKDKPHHHHHVPFDRSQKQNNPDVRDIEDAFEKIKPYLENGKTYP